MTEDTEDILKIVTEMQVYLVVNKVELAKILDINATSLYRTHSCSRKKRGTNIDVLILAFERCKTAKEYELGQLRTRIKHAVRFGHRLDPFLVLLEFALRRELA